MSVFGVGRSSGRKQSIECDFIRQHLRDRVCSNYG
jgi:hypothetical protein